MTLFRKHIGKTIVSYFREAHTKTLFANIDIATRLPQQDIWPSIDIIALFSLKHQNNINNEY